MRKLHRSIIAGVLLAGLLGIPAVRAADLPASADTGKLSTGLTAISKLVGLMDTDKNGRISKQEFMQFMEAEFDFADKNKDGQLDPVELKGLVYRLNHPLSGLPPVRK